MRKPSTLSSDKRKGNFDEVELCYSKSIAMKEAKRCLRCDLEIELQEKIEQEKKVKEASI